MFEPVAHAEFICLLAEELWPGPFEEFKHMHVLGDCKSDSEVDAVMSSMPAFIAERRRNEAEAAGMTDF